MAENRILKIIDSLFPKRRYQEVIQHLDELKDMDLSKEEMESWYYWRSHTGFLTGNVENAFEILRQGLDRFPNSGFINLGMAQGYEGIGQIESALPYFNQVTLKNIEPQRLLFKSHLLYLWDYYSLALESMGEIFDLYHQDRNLDETHLWIARIPLYDIAFGYLATIAMSAKNIGFAVEELRSAKREIPVYAFEHEQMILDATIACDWSRVLKQLGEIDWGAGKIKRSVLESRQCSNLSEAVQRLKIDSLVGKDERLASGFVGILITAAAETANKFGEFDLEEQLTDVLIDRRPLLLYPSEAFEYGFIDYQEKLKKKYQMMKKSRKGIFLIDGINQESSPSIQEVYRNLIQMYFNDKN
jgi:tetratricopeptide (TPR) repeat protein